MASGAEVVAHFDALMQERFLPSGRVTFLPMSDHEGEGRVRNLVTGDVVDVQHRTLVDATWFRTSIPRRHTPEFGVDAGVSVVTPNELRRAAPTHRNVCVLGGGKTGMDACLFLMEMGVLPEAIRWMVPRASWCLNRQTVQPGGGVLAASEANLLEAVVVATSADDLFDMLEARGEMLRIHADVRRSGCAMRSCRRMRRRCWPVFPVWFAWDGCRESRLVGWCWNRVKSRRGPTSCMSTAPPAVLSQILAINGCLSPMKIPPSAPT